MENKRFYQKTWFIWLTLLCLFPLGIFLLYKYSTYSKKTKAILACLSIMFCIFANVNSYQQQQAKKTITDHETKLINYEIIKIDKLSHDRLNVVVFVKEKPTIEQLGKIAMLIVKDQKNINSNKVYGIYISFTNTKEQSSYTYGQAEYGPGGSAGFDFKNPTPSDPDKLDMSRIHI